MSNSTNEFQALWNRDDTDTNSTKVDEVRQRILNDVRSPQKDSINAQVGTTIILTVLVVILSLFFKYVSPVEESLSVFGKGLMIGSIIGRIVFELIGIYLARKIDLFESVSAFVKKSRVYVQFRHKVHRYMVLITFVLYSIGYYLLIPEWSNYFSLAMIWLLIVSYVIIMVAVFFLAIRPGIRGEKEALCELEILANELEESQS